MQATLLFTKAQISGLLSACLESGCLFIDFKDSDSHSRPCLVQGLRDSGFRGLGFPWQAHLPLPEGSWVVTCRVPDTYIHL